MTDINPPQAALFQPQPRIIATIARIVLLVLLVASVGLIVSAVVTQPPTGILWDFTGDGRITSVAIGRDGEQIAFGSTDNRLRVYDRAGTILWEFEAENSILGVDTSLDGQWTAVASEDRHVYLLDAAGQALWQFKAQRTMNNAAVADDGSLVAASSNDRSIYVLDGDGNFLWQHTDGIDVEALDIYGSGDNARVVVGTDASKITIYSRDGRALLETYLDYAVKALAVNGNGARIVAGSFDGTITLVHGGNGEVLWQVAADDPITGIAISRDGETVLASTLRGQALLLDGSGQIVQPFDQITRTNVALSADGNVLAFATDDGRSQLQDQQVAASAFRARESQRTAAITGSLGVLIVAVIAATWAVRTTDSGRRIWQQYTTRPRRLLRAIWRSRLSYLFLLPTIFLLLIFNYYPASSGLYHAFTDWKPGATTEWVGLDNFRFLFQDRFFWAGFGNAFILVIVEITKIITIPLLVAELIFHVRNVRIKYLLRTLFIVPIVLPGVVQILVWNNIYDPTIGLLNQTLIALGLENLTQVWYGDASIALLAIIFIGFPWVNPFALLVYYGGLISISDEIFDAAEVDGASGLRRFWHIDLPLLFGQLRLLIILTFIASVQIFELVFLTTGGGPGAATYTPALELYLMATRLDKLGVASAIGIVLFVIILSGTIISYRSRRQAAT